MKVLIVKISSMGDIVHTLPAVTDAFFAVPNISFDWIIEKNFSEIPKWHIAVDQVIPINLRFWKKNWCKFSSWREYFQCIELLKKKDYDLIIDAQGLLKTSFFITSIINGEKHGMDCISARESISACFLNQRYYVNKKKHAIQRIRQLFAYSLKYSVPTSTGIYNIDHIFPRNINNNFPYLIFFHATTQLEKNWEESNWNILIQYVIDAGYNVKLPCWTKCEISRAQRLSKRFDQVFILFKLTLYQIAVQISQAIAVVSVDTGLSHLTAALNCPNLTLYGPTDPRLIGTYGLNQSIIRSKTNKMKDLTALCVWRAFEKILKNCNQK